MPRFAPVPSRTHFAAAELEVLDLWRRGRVFERSLEQRRGAPRYVFYEGPPTANGLPGIHHVLSRSYKDVFARHRQMAGYHVERKAGWDTHGLPVELEIERALHISGKKQIEEYGVERFNALCRESVNEYIDQWREMSERLGFWLDFDHPYRTYDTTYIESVWWSLKQLFERDLLYKGYKVTPYCPRCQTSLSSHELSLGYHDDTPDPSVYVKFRLNDSDGKTFLLAWTTTPWTLPGNVALAVHPDETYVRVVQNGESYIIAKARINVLDPGYDVLAEMHGRDLVDSTYEPLFTDMLPDGLAFVVVDAPELVSMSEGTGIVHTAAAYGTADLELCQQKGIAIRHVVGLDGRFLEGQTRYRGMFVKDADAEIIEDLRREGKLYRSERILHSYPFCWRCETPLLYYALDSWFIRTTAQRNRLLHHNHVVGWHPQHIRDGRMGNWLENLIDWNLSRSRYWGTPLPIWVCETCAEARCVGSAAELGLDTTADLHKPYIDDVTLPCERCQGEMRRVADVIDAWYDSGAMPFAQRHYPFENQELFEQTHPADFICEGLDQTRGWFFSLLAESTLLFDKPAYRNCVVVGIVVDQKGKKMSKSRGNVMDPAMAFADFGADATRWFFYASGALAAELRVSREALQDVVRLFMLTLWNVYSFFVTYAEIDGFDPANATGPPVPERPALDRWCMSRLAQTVDTVRAALDGYEAQDACRAIETFVEDLSKWYVRRSRRRFWKGEGESADKHSAYATLYTALLTLSRLLAPLMPFVSERMYRNLVGYEGDQPPGDGVPDSVHLTDYPETDGVWRDADVLHDMEHLRRLVEAGLAARTAVRVPTRQPLRAAVVRGEPLSPELEAIFADELNVKTVEYMRGDTPRIPPDMREDTPRTPPGRGVDTPRVDLPRVDTPRVPPDVAMDTPAAPAEAVTELVTLDTHITDELHLEWIARELSRKANELRRQAKLRVDDRIVLAVDATGDVARAVDDYRAWLMGETLAISIERARGDALAEWSGDLAGEPCWLGVRR
jgi:isoleucyl-tRNA synthetase